MQLLFTCCFLEGRSDTDIELLQRDVWRRCENLGLGGFFVRSGDRLIGLLEGHEKAVISQVEHLIRKRKVLSVHVVREVHEVAQKWPRWNSDVFNLGDLTQSQRSRIGGLAQIVEIAVDADRKVSP